MYTCNHLPTQPHTQPRTHAWMHARMHARTHACTHGCTHPPTHTLSLPLTHSHNHSHKHTHTHTYTKVHTLTYKIICTYVTNMQMHATQAYRIPTLNNCTCVCVCVRVLYTSYVCMCITAPSSVAPYADTIFCVSKPRAWTSQTNVSTRQQR